MGTQFDESDFVDRDYEESQTASPDSTPPVMTAKTPAIPSREELSAKVTETQKKLAELKRVQEELEQERSVLEETRRKQNEFYTGRDEMLNHLTRGVELLQEAEQDARRDAEQMARTLEELREALGKVSQLSEESWAQESDGAELTRALAVIDHARMEWNTARQKWPILTRNPSDEGESIQLEGDARHPLADFPLTSQNLRYLCKVGLALTWPLALVGFLTLVAFLIFALAR